MANYFYPSLGGGGGGGGTLTSINADVTPAQLLTTAEAGTNFAITDPGAGSHVFNLPVASALNTGKLSAADWTTFNAKPNGAGGAGLVGLWTTATDIGANIFFGRSNATGIVYNEQGLTTSATPTTQNRYVDPVLGNNANAGTAPGAGSAWQTINYAISQQPQVAGGIYQINLADGTYAESIFFKDIIGNAADTTSGNNVVSIVGNTATPANVIIQSGTNAFTLTNTRGVLVLDGLTIDGNATSNAGILAFNAIFDLKNVDIQNALFGMQLNEGTRARWLNGATGGNITVSTTAVTMARGASFSVQKPITLTVGTGFGFSLSSNALLGITSSTTTLNIVGTSGIAGIQVGTGAVLSSSAATINISGMTSGGNGYGIRVINGGLATLTDGVTINLTGCTRAGQITSNSYFQDGGVGNTWNYLGGTAAEWLVDSNTLIFAPTTFTGAVVNSSSQASYINGNWWNKQSTITADTTLNSQNYSVKCNAAIPIAVTLPLASTVGVGRTYVIADISGNSAVNTITLTCSGGDLIDGAATYPINTNYGTATVEAISTGWSVI